jgi:hypothetical protein
VGNQEGETKLGKPKRGKASSDGVNKIGITRMEKNVKGKRGCLRNGGRGSVNERALDSVDRKSSIPPSEEGVC